jgi:hypothetical protein
VVSDKEDPMQLYGIRRRGWWKSPEELEAGAARSKEVGDMDGSGVRWIRSYVLMEDDGSLGTYCIYEAESPEALRAHAEKAGFGAEEINAVAETVVIRPDPVEASA